MKIYVKVCICEELYNLDENRQVSICDRASDRVFLLPFN